MSLEEINYLSGDLPKPEVNPDHLRVYGHQLCPFVQRAYFSLTAKDIPYQKVNVELRNKAQWHLDINGGLIPLLESPDGTIVHESGFIAQFAREYAKPGQGTPLMPNDDSQSDLKKSMETALIKLQMQKFDQIFSKFWPAFLSLFKDDAKNLEAQETFEKLEEFVIFNLKGSDYLSGNQQPMMIDYHSYPMLERIVLLENSPWHYAFEHFDIKNKYPTLYAYVHRFRAHPRHQKDIIKTECYNKLLQYWSENPHTKAMLSIEFL